MFIERYGFQLAVKKNHNPKVLPVVLLFFIINSSAIYTFQILKSVISGCNSWATMDTITAIPTVIMNSEYNY